MGNWKKDPQGRFAGSIGEGKNDVPRPAITRNHLTPLPGSAAGPAPVDLDDLAARARAATAGDPRFDFLVAAEREVEEASYRWEQARTWAYPGVGDEEGEQELAESYEHLSLVRQNLFHARLLAAQNPEGEELLEAQMAKWNSLGEAAASYGWDNALALFVRAQEIHDALSEARRQREVQATFDKIVEEETSQLRGR
jgi:hypothetical protein